MVEFAVAPSVTIVAASGVPQTMWIALGGGLLFGFFNSLHCVGMCGPLIAAVHAGGGQVPSRGGATASLSYHAARAVSYGTVGGIAGVLGGAIHAESLEGFGAVLALVFAAAVLASAFLPRGVVAERFPRLKRVVGSVVRVAQSMPPGQRAAALGLVTPLLPCGLLFAAVVLAIATAHPVAGVATMVGFALGAAPALTFAEWNFERLRLRVGARAAQNLGRAAMVLAAGMLAWRGIAELAFGPAACCAHG